MDEDFCGDHSGPIDFPNFFVKLYDEDGHYRDVVDFEGIHKIHQNTVNDVIEVHVDSAIIEANNKTYISIYEISPIGL